MQRKKCYCCGFEEKCAQMDVLITSTSEVIIEDKPFMSHMYSSGVYHWRTQKSSNLNYWIGLIKKIEDKIGQF